MDDVDTTNKFFVGATGNGFVIQGARMGMLSGIISTDDALVLAAYLVTMSADPKRWEQVLEAVKNT